MPPPITIIVAVYRAEAYFHYCMQSLLNQTFRDFEILLMQKRMRVSEYFIRKTVG